MGSARELGSGRENIVASDRMPFSTNSVFQKNQQQKGYPITIAFIDTITMTEASRSSYHPAARPSTLALASYANMFCVGGAYALSTIQSEFPRLLDMPQQSSFAPFASACFGLSFGLGTCASLLSTLGARATAASGTAIWGLALIGTGHALAMSNFVGILIAVAFGGIGVGYTYLSIIVLVGQGFPQRPLARSAIGPLGFSTGAGACIGSYSYFSFSSIDQQSLGHLVRLSGYISIPVALCTMIALPNDLTQFTGSPDSEQKVASPRRAFRTLLFFNALPGMTAFAGILPLANLYSEPDHQYTALILPLIMVALALGGLLAQSFQGWLGARASFSVLFILRGAMLLRLAQYPSGLQATITLLSILFAHGMGFGILPGLIKRYHSQPAAFAYSYGSVLVAWGVAGVVGAILCASSISSKENLTTVCSVMGVITLVCGATIQLFSFGDILC
ncbi:unnamed protein product [Clonostachys rosea f. rosea IK726]|uniref:Uncharacterized protein n=2 Tax=Clonostachys rosea f. rosea IK726 TaxID=1349383 RepID=A0ACA9UQ42_BIOOC|nr:unnamed protein product [Clonostachys rosea f. rosea IK726]CAG9955559.1 unnamed protein product [Clonostachys rosea f. rosea IK726]